VAYLAPALSKPRDVIGNYYQMLGLGKCGILRILSGLSTEKAAERKEKET